MVSFNDQMSLLQSGDALKFMTDQHNELAEIAPQGERPGKGMALKPWLHWMQKPWINLEHDPDFLAFVSPDSRGAFPPPNSALRSYTLFSTPSILLHISSIALKSLDFVCCNLKP
ncbi:hypothetical protein GQ457_01G030480 [Hibiscus cannabinus]